MILLSQHLFHKRGTFVKLKGQMGIYSLYQNRIMAATGNCKHS